MCISAVARATLMYNQQNVDVMQYCVQAVQTFQCKLHAMFLLPDKWHSLYVRSGHHSVFLNKLWCEQGAKSHHQLPVQSSKQVPQLAVQFSTQILSFGAVIAWSKNFCRPDSSSCTKDDMMHSKTHSMMASNSSNCLTIMIQSSYKLAVVLATASVLVSSQHLRNHCHVPKIGCCQLSAFDLYICTSQLMHHDSTWPCFKNSLHMPRLVCVPYAVVSREQTLNVSVDSCIMCMQAYALTQHKVCCRRFALDMVQCTGSLCMC